ncbi:MAG: Zn-dependent hydrolase [Candidatus Eisenbacteria bacterium]|uniref:Zn-dependent hydrolase n=1 Tax=Eiseniibacteriota bacterium TaxID=2212470 RepID=A0A9D6L4N3_UNCEI|nr:Zn-dependent hydrolase [Candidatus Eisenbacteria bacterium]
MPAIAAHDVTDRLAELARFTGRGAGVTRLVYDEAWCAAHRWLASEARAMGLAATADWAGNLYLHDPAVKPGHAAPPVLMVGSHLDSVKHGGRLDGAYGTIAGLLVAHASRGMAGLPVVGFVSSEEEGSRFHGGMMGARSMLGMVDERELDTVADREGITWRDALEDARARGCAAALPRAPFAPLFRPAIELELHIEQGPVLEAEGLALAIVDRIAGYRHWTAWIEGEARHAGTTPMRLRHDALAAAGEMILAAEHAAGEAGEPAVATVGFARPSPGLFNVVPGTCELWLECRHVRGDDLEALADAVTRRWREVAQRRGVRLGLEEGPGQPPTALSAALADAATDLAREMRLAHRRMASGAGHDTMVFAQAGVPTLMAFVPSRAGVSHSPDEATDDDHLVTGVQFLAALTRRLAEHTPR